MLRRMLLMLSFLAPDARACSDEDFAPPPGVAVSGVAGWSADGRWFAFTVTRHDGEDNATPGGGVLDTRTDAIEILDEDAFAAWKTAHPFARPRAGERCGAVSAIRRTEDLSGFSSAGDIPEVQLTTLGVEALGTAWIHAEYEGGSPPEPAWSPDCAHVAWTFVGRRMDYADRRGVGPWSPSGAVLVRPAGPVVHIMAHKTARDTVDPVFEALTGAGFAPHIGPNALKDRPATVVYATRHARDVAQRVAAAVPGGATVEALDWPSPADIVVAAGTSARP